MWPFADMSLESASLWSDVANVALLASLLVGVLATFSIVRLSNVKEHHWDAAREEARVRISDNEVATAKAIERAADLERQAQELSAKNLELEAQIQPRRLSGENAAKLTAALSNMQRLPIGIVSRLFDTEGNDFADDLEKAFKAAGWIPVRQKDWTMPMRGVAVASFEGTVLPPELVSGLIAALDDGKVVATVTTVDTASQKTTSANFQPNVLYLLVGAKP